MQTVAHLIDALGGSIRVATAIGRPVGTVSAWKTRLCIPGEYWQELVDLAKGSGCSSVTYEALAAAHAAERRRPVDLPAVHSSVQ